MHYYMEARTTYGRTIYAVNDASGRTVCRCDSREDALSIIAALAAQVSK